MPAARLDAALHVTCNGAEVEAALPLEFAKNQVSTLDFDGAKLTLVRSAFLDPASMDSLRGDLLKMQDAANTADAVLSRLTQWVVASVALDVALIVVVFATTKHGRGRKITAGVRD